MAPLIIQSLNVVNGEARTLSLILLVLAVLLILAGAVIAVITSSYARKDRGSLNDKEPLGRGH